MAKLAREVHPPAAPTSVEQDFRFIPNWNISVTMTSDTVPAGRKRGDPSCPRSHRARWKRITTSANLGKQHGKMFPG